MYPSDVIKYTCKTQAYMVNYCKTITLTGYANYTTGLIPNLCYYKLITCFEYMHVTKLAFIN